MLEATEEQGRLELRNRSEMIREALRYYLTRIPTEPATRGDVATPEQGRREIARGEYVTLNQLRYEWTVIVAHTAQKQLAKLPAPERRRLLAALTELEGDPFAGDVKRLTNYGVAFRRRRVYESRILFNLNLDDGWVEVVAVERRSDETYRRR
jgi:mRNA-degrading endonuclease RelE of RelBE toxin-antitoxin system